MTEEDILIIPASDVSDVRQVRFFPVLTWLRSMVVWWRDETALERSQRKRIAALELTVKGLTNDLEFAQHEKSILKTQLQGVKDALVYHEERWKALAQIQAIRVAKATLRP